MPTAPQSSFVPIAADSHFPIQNLPYGVFNRRSEPIPRIGVAIGEFVLDLAVLERRGVLPAVFRCSTFHRPNLNLFMTAGREEWRRTRERIQSLLSADNPTLRDNLELRAEALVPIKEAELLLPVEIGDYTDFYSSREHATNCGTMLRGPDQALFPNWLHLPVAYHGRASSIVASGTYVRRPMGQTKSEQAIAPTFGPSRAVDFELEMGMFVGQGSELGQPIPIGQAADHLFGMVLVNDWSARDIQKWEYVPLGPFLAKSFCTTVSPWVVTFDALEPFRVPGPVQDPPVLEYLRCDQPAAYDIQLEVALAPSGGESTTICRSNFRHLYWNWLQQVAHHTSNGCNLRTGDLLASGTVSGPAPDARGCLLELTWGGRDPVKLAGGQTRRFLEDGDSVTLTGWCQGDGYRVGFGQATGKLIPARAR